MVCIKDGYAFCRSQFEALLYTILLAHTVTPFIRIERRSPLARPRTTRPHTPSSTPIPRSAALVIHNRTPFINDVHSRGISTSLTEEIAGWVMLCLLKSAPYSLITGWWTVLEWLTSAWRDTKGKAQQSTQKTSQIARVFGWLDASEYVCWNMWLVSLEYCLDHSRW